MVITNFIHKLSTKGEILQYLSLNRNSSFKGISSFFYIKTERKKAFSCLYLWYRTYKLICKGICILTQVKRAHQSPFLRSFHQNRLARRAVRSRWVWEVRLAQVHLLGAELKPFHSHCPALWRTRNTVLVVFVWLIGLVSGVYGLIYWVISPH